MQMDKKLAYAGIVLALSLAMVLAFQKNMYGDGEYGLLLGSGMSLATASMIGIGLVIALPLLIYLVSVYALKSDEFNALLAALAFSLCGANANALFSLAPLVATFLGKSYGIADAAKLAGATLPLGAIALLGYKKDAKVAALAGLGIIILPFAPGVSVVLLAIAAAKGIEMMEKDKHGDRALVFAVFVFAFQQAYAGDLTAGLVTSLFIAAIAFVAISLHNVKSEEVYALVMVFLAFSALAMLFGIDNAGKNTLSAGEIAFYSSAKDLESVGVLDYPNAFQYYSGKKPELVDGAVLLKKNATLPGEILLSKRSLLQAYGTKPIFFIYAGSGTDANGGDVAVFANQYYALYARVNQGALLVEDWQLLNQKTGEGALIPFTKIKQIYGAKFNSTDAMLVNTQEIENSVLRSLLFSSNVSFQENGTIVKVR